MREKILLTATDLFLSLGFKSVTMDDIANNIGISKKTIYQHFENKTKLVEAATFQLFDTICDGIDMICDASANPIQELYDIKMFVMNHLKNVLLYSGICYLKPSRPFNYIWCSIVYLVGNYSSQPCRNNQYTSK